MTFSQKCAGIHTTAGLVFVVRFVCLRQPLFKCYCPGDYLNGYNLYSLHCHPEAVRGLTGPDVAALSDSGFGFINTILGARIAQSVESRFRDLKVAGSILSLIHI